MPPPGIRRARSRNTQCHFVKCLKVLYFIVLLHSLRRVAINQAKSIGKRNEFKIFRNPSKYFLDDFWNLKWSPGALEREVIFCYLSNGFEVVFFLVHSLAGWRSTRPKVLENVMISQLSGILQNMFLMAFGISSCLPVLLSGRSFFATCLTDLR